MTASYPITPFCPVPGRVHATSMKLHQMFVESLLQGTAIIYRTSWPQIKTEPNEEANQLASKMILAIAQAVLDSSPADPPPHQASAEADGSSSDAGSHPSDSDSGD